MAQQNANKIVDQRLSKTYCALVYPALCMAVEEYDTGHEILLGK